MGTSNVLNHTLPADSTGNNEKIFGGTFKTGTGQNLKTFVLIHRLDMSHTEIERLMVPFPSKLITIQAILNTTQGGGDLTGVDYAGPQGALGQTNFTNIAAGAQIVVNVTSNNIYTIADALTMTKTSTGAANTFFGITFVFEYL